MSMKLTHVKISSSFKPACFFLKKGEKRPILRLGNLSTFDNFPLARNVKVRFYPLSLGGVYRLNP